MNNLINKKLKSFEKKFVCMEDLPYHKCEHLIDSQNYKENFKPWLIKALAGQQEEIVICPAVKMYDGRILRGQRHNDCVKLAASLGYETPITFDRQGFITSKNRFVNRVEARHIQEKAGVKCLNHDGYSDMLYSEDLY